MYYHKVSLLKTQKFKVTDKFFSILSIVKNFNGRFFYGKIYGKVFTLRMNE